MAFIRWKKTAIGTWKSYLVHSYRDEQGRPRHKHLAYLGDKPRLEPEHLEKLKQRHAHLAVQWEGIRPAGPPKRKDFSRMSDKELIQNLSLIRREHGLDYWDMAKRLADAGAPCRTDTSRPSTETLGPVMYKFFERRICRGEEPIFYKNPAKDLAPAIRKAFCSA